MDIDLWLSRDRGYWEGVGWELGVIRCEVLHIEWMNNKAQHMAEGAIFNILR